MGIRKSSKESIIKSTDDAREYLITWMNKNFVGDKTFKDYITNHLAGDFAYQLAKALERPRRPE